MTVSELLQFYAPFVGLLGLAFWVGVLSQKVRDQGDDIRDLKAASADGGVETKITRLQVEMENVQASLEKLDRSMDSVNRQLGNLMQKGGPAIVQLNP